MKGAYIITIGIIISKALSLFFIFPFANLVGSNGLSLYSYAYVPYSLFLDLSTLGIPLGISKLVSKYNTLNKHRTVNTLLKQSLKIMLIITFIMFILLNIFASSYAKLVLGGSKSNDLNDVINVIRIISISLLIVPFLSVLRGYYHGLNRTFPTMFSQIIEQLVRVSFILVGSYIVIYKLNKDSIIAVYIAVFGAFLGGIFGLITLLFFNKKKLDSKEKVSKKELGKELIKYAIPYSIIGLNLSIYNLIDSLTFNKALISSGILDAERYYGVYSFEITKLVSIPLALAIGLSTVLMPSLTKNQILNNNEETKKIIAKSFNSIFLVLIPIVFITMFDAYNLYSLFFNDYEIGGIILFFYAPLIIFFSLNNITNSIMIGLNKTKILIVFLLIGVIIKASFNYLFVYNFGFIGAILSTIISIMFVQISSQYILKELNYLDIILHGLFKGTIFSLISLLGIKASTVFLSYSGNEKIFNFLYLSFHTILFFLIYISLNYFYERSEKNGRQKAIATQ